MDPIDQITRLLGPAEEPHRRIAAAVVLASLKPRAPATVAALTAMAQEEHEPFARPALLALGEIGSPKALPVLLAALERSPEIAQAARQAIAALGPEALPAIRDRLEDASPELRATLSQLLPSLGGKLSLELTLQGLLGQPFEAASKVALSVRAQVKDASPAERRALRAPLEKFLEKKGTRADEVALRAGLKILGYLELEESTDTLLLHTAATHAPLVRVEAVTGLRFGLRAGASRKVVKRLIVLLEDREALVARAARDTLTVITLEPGAAVDLAALASGPSGELAQWVIAKLGSLGGEVAAQTLLPVARSPDRARATAAARALAGLPQGPKLLAVALAEAQGELEAQVLAEALLPLVKVLESKEQAALQKAAVRDLRESPGLGKRKLDVLRELDPAAWGEAMRTAARALSKKQPERAEPLLTALSRSSVATPADRYASARLLLLRSPLDPHPRSRQRDPALLELQALADRGHPLGRELEDDDALTDEARFYVAFHFAEAHVPELRAVGLSLLEGIATRGKRTKLGKAARNKLQLLQGSP
jgi:hypothetical protein